MPDCWCRGGTAGFAQHVRLDKGATACGETREAKRAYDRDREKRRSRIRIWTPGTPILVPELDPL